MKIRTAALEDCPALAALDARCNPSPWSAAQFQTALHSPHDYVVVLEGAGQTLAGFAVWQTLFDESELHRPDLQVPQQAARPEQIVPHLASHFQKFLGFQKQHRPKPSW